MKIQAHYNQFQNFLEQLPDQYNIDSAFVDDYNSMIDTLAIDISQDLSEFKVEGYPDDSYNGGNWYRITKLKLKLGRIIGYLKGEYELSDTENSNSQNSSAISIINTNTIAITITQNIQQLIDASKDKEEKNRLTELKEELEKSQKDWSKIKATLKWALDFSEKLFFQLLPIILKQYSVIN